MLSMVGLTFSVFSCQTQCYNFYFYGICYLLYAFTAWLDFQGSFCNTHLCATILWLSNKTYLLNCVAFSFSMVGVSLMRA